jgi:hypothetical protein
MYSNFPGLCSTVRVRWVVCCCGLLILAGCSESLGKLVPVQGKVVLADGKPLPGGHVTFFLIERDPKTPSLTPEGKIEADGSYVLYTKGQLGAPPGKYRVVLLRGSDRKAWSKIAPQYSNQKKSPLELEVVDNKPEGGYDLKLKPRSGR